MSYLVVYCSIAGEEYVIVNVYNKPISRKSYRQKLVKWFNMIWLDVQHFPTHKILIGGDFNIQLESPSKDHLQVEGQKILQAFLSETELTDCWSVLHPSDIRHTFYTKNRHHRFIGSTLDYLFLSPLLANYLHSSSVGLQFQSDHCPLEATFLLNRNPRGPGVFCFPGYLLGDTSFCSILTDMIQEIVKNCDEDPPPYFGIK